MYFQHHNSVLLAPVVLVCAFLWPLFTALTTAKELIHSWLHKEENPSYDDGYDWLPSDDVDIQSAVTSIMDDLMNKPLDYATVGRGDSEKRTDPRVAMEMRHKKV